MRLIGALLAEKAESWQERIYLDMQEFREWQLADDRKVAVALPIAS